MSTVYQTKFRPEDTQSKVLTDSVYTKTETIIFFFNYYFVIGLQQHWGAALKKLVGQFDLKYSNVLQLDMPILHIEYIRRTWYIHNNYW